MYVQAVIPSLLVKSVDPQTDTKKLIHHAMNMVIRDKHTEAFFSKEGVWTNEYQKAWHLATLQEAARVEATFKLRNVELYCDYREEPSAPDPKNQLEEVQTSFEFLQRSCPHKD